MMRDGTPLGLLAELRQDELLEVGLHRRQSTQVVRRRRDGVLGATLRRVLRGRQR